MPLDRTNDYTKQYAESCKDVAQVYIWGGWNTMRVLHVSTQTVLFIYWLWELLLSVHLEGAWPPRYRFVDKHAARRGKKLTVKVSKRYVPDIISQRLFLSPSGLGHEALWRRSPLYSGGKPALFWGSDGWSELYVPRPSVSDNKVISGSCSIDPKHRMGTKQIMSSIRVEKLPINFPAWDTIDPSNPAASFSSAAPKSSSKKPEPLWSLGEGFLPLFLMTAAASPGGKLSVITKSLSV